MMITTSIWWFSLRKDVRTGAFYVDLIQTHDMKWWGAGYNHTKYGHLFLHPQNPPSESQNPCIFAKPVSLRLQYIENPHPDIFFDVKNLTYQKDGDRDHLPPQIEKKTKVEKTTSRIVLCMLMMLKAEPDLTPGQDDSRIFQKSSCFFCIKILGSYFHEVIF